MKKKELKFKLVRAQLKAATLELELLELKEKIKQGQAKRKTASGRIIDIGGDEF